SQDMQRSSGTVYELNCATEADELLTRDRFIGNN
ncbi:hypothetical protein CEXT_442001, partial [Caerostris extrusa]